MLMPKKVKYRKQQRGRMTGKAWRGSSIAFGDFGLKAMECGWITDRQIEAARIAMTRSIKRGGKVWIRLFPDKPITKKPAETRMGKGKGAPEQWVAVIRPGKILFEMEGVTRKSRRRRCGWRRKDPHADQVRHAGTGGVTAHERERGKSTGPGRGRDRQAIARCDEQMFRLRFQMSMGQTDGLKKLRKLRKERARMLTVLRERELGQAVTPAAKPVKATKAAAKAEVKKVAGEKGCGQEGSGSQSGSQETGRQKGE